MEKSGPFVYEHGDVTERCTNCHTPHGSVNRRLLGAAMPFLCIQCHNPAHASVASKLSKVKALFANRCSDCHSAIHGSDTPDNLGYGTLRK
jgi:predicted CXXCH cytochrome family protein